MYTYIQTFIRLDMFNTQRERERDSACHISDFSALTRK